MFTGRLFDGSELPCRRWAAKEDSGVDRQLWGWGYPNQLGAHRSASKSWKQKQANAEVLKRVIDLLKYGPNPSQGKGRPASLPLA